ncbi:MAG: amidohydrolase [Myxococcales bacterium]|nr:amidohydrolase [Myxococcales bacterium]
MDEKNPQVEAVAVKDGRILFAGSEEEARAYISQETTSIDLQGKTMTPGFIESHGHMMGLGYSQLNLDLTKIRNYDEMVQLVAEAVKKTEPGLWILGRGWHQSKWDTVPVPLVKGFQTHEKLSAVSPDNPVYLAHASGHAVFVNAAAMKIAGIDSSTPDPSGGAIVKDSKGHPTGMLRESAEALVREAINRENRKQSEQEREAEFRQQMELAGWEALSKGITSIHDAGSSFDDIDRFKRWADEGALPVRLYVMVALDETNEVLGERLFDYRIIPEGNDFLAVRSIKRMVDGGLGAHGAWLLAPYTDMPETVGLVLDTPENIEETGRIAIRHGFQLNTHAIGDRGNREILDVYERLFAANPSARNLRWRIEHAQHVDPADVPRFAELGVIASMQGVHATSDGPWLPKRLGQKRAGEISYVWRSLIDSGAIVTNGTDAPVEDVDPIASFHASVARQMANGEYFHPEQSMTRAEALRSYTIDNAYAAFEEHLKGSITPGKLADITVISKDITKIPLDEIPTAKVDYTIVGGKIAYSRAAN